MKQSVSVDQRDGVIAVSSYSRVLAGYSAMNGVIVRLPGDLADEIVGAAVSLALDASGENMPTPPHDAGIDRPLLRMFAARSYGQYMVGTLSIRVTRDGDLVEVVPQRNQAKDGFTDMLDAILTVNAPHDAALGQAVREGLARAT